MRLPWSTSALLAAIAVVQGNLWLGRSNMPQVITLGAQLAEQRAANEAAYARNQRTVAELADLQEGLEMVEERARAELRMLRPDEILVQYTRAATAPQAASASAAGTP